MEQICRYFLPSIIYVNTIKRENSDLADFKYLFTEERL